MDAKIALDATLRTAGYRLKAIEQEEDRRTVWKTKGEKRLCSEDPQLATGPLVVSSRFDYLGFF